MNASDRRIGERRSADHDSYIEINSRTFGSDPQTKIGLLAAMLALPALLSRWAPQWFWISFVVIDVLIQCGTYVASRRYRQHARAIHFAEVIATGTLFSLIPLSARWFAEEPAELWMLIGVIVLAFVAHESFTKPQLPNYEWRAGVAIIIVVTTLWFAVPYAGWIVSIAFILLNAGAIQSGSRAREAHFRLEEARARAEAQRALADQQRATAEQRAIRDPLTGLLNRRGLTDALERTSTGPSSVVIIDADRFKDINDTWGLATGDEALCAIAAALRRRFGDEWGLARLGGDEFAAVATGHHPFPGNLVDKVSFTPRLASRQVVLELGVSAGLTHSTRESTPDQLLSEAGYALRMAKRSPGVQMRTLEGSLRDEYERSSEIRALLATSLNDGEFTAFIQPIVDASVGTIGGELLARWEAKDGEMLMPSEFLPLLAESGMLPELESRMISLAVQFAARFNHLVHAPYVSINLSASHLALPQLVPFVTSLLEEHRVPADRLLIEITESESLDRVDGWEGPAEALRAAGVGLAIDDFGSGYSNVERITSLPISHLKLDRAFTTRVSGSFGEIVRGVVNFAKATQLGIIAEGIETFDQKVAMEAIGVTVMQGFWFAKPMVLDDFERRILEERPVGGHITSTTQP